MLISKVFDIHDMRKMILFALLYKTDDYLFSYQRQSFFELYYGNARELF